MERVDEGQIAQIVERVIGELKKEQSAPTISTPVRAEEPRVGQYGIFPDVDSAVKAAAEAFKIWGRTTLEQRHKVIANIRAVMRENAKLLAWEAWNETGLGRYEDKLEKNLLNANKTPGPEDLQPVAYTGDHGLTLIERAPFGVVAAITPSTNPTSTIINNSIMITSAGNAVVFNVHPMAKHCSALNIQLINQAILAAGGPTNLVTGVAEPTIESAQALMRHPQVRIILVTGGIGVVREAMQSGKRSITAGPGNPPVVVDETAVIEQAARDTVKGASFDNNIVCTDEKEVFVVESVADPLLAALKRHHCVEVSPYQLKRLERVIFSEMGEPFKPGVINKNFIGKNASIILKEIGVSAGDEVRLIIAEVPLEHPLIWTEQMMPVLPIARVKSADEGIDWAIKAEHGFGHTAVMHSRHLDHLDRMAREINTSIFVKNGSNLAGLGYGGEGWCSFSIASPTGEGMTRPTTFTRERRCTLVDHFRFV
ncbi:MAG: aldehyde dehydrogenase EutE [Chloroflexi bacterium]|nr:aldehyde dehydrogenase EutE [Chloroflexota bacterium]